MIELQGASGDGAETALIFILGYGETRKIRGDHESGNTLCALGGVGHGKDAGDVCFTAVGDEALLAVDDPFIAILDSGSLDVGCIRTGLRLGQAEAGVAFPFQDVLREILNLLRGAADQDGLQGQVGGLHDGGEVAVIVSHLFIHHRSCGQVDLAAAVFLGDLKGVQAQLECLGIGIKGNGLGGIGNFVPVQHDGLDLFLCKLTDDITPMLLFFC